MPPDFEERPLLVLLPGLDGTGLMFTPFIRALDGFDVRVVRYPTTLTSYGACTHFARLQLPQDRAFLLLGESFSGPVALALAAEQPKGLVALALSGSFVRNPRPGLAWAAPLLRLLPIRRLPLALICFLLLGRWATEPTIDLVRLLNSEAAPSALRARLQAVLAVDHTALLSRLHLPVLALVAAQDRLVPRTATAWIRAHLPSLDITTLHGPHWLLQARPEAAARALKEFLSRIPAKRWQ